MSESELFDVSEEAVNEFRALMQDPASRQAFVTLKQEKQVSRRSYSNVVRLMTATPWAMLEDPLRALIDIVVFRVEGGRYGAEEIAARIGPGRDPSPGGSGGVAVVPLQGVIMPKADMMTEMSGGTSIAGFRSMFREAMASSDVSAVVLDVDSPGGMVDQVPEMAAEIRAARGTKPIWAVANTNMASAAYWLASQADKIIASKSSRLGSIGVVTIHEDHSEQAAKDGVKFNIISAGEHKAEDTPFQPLSEEALGAIQKKVDAYYGMFVSDVSRGRKASVADVRAGYGQGGMLMAKEAVEAGLADGIGTLEGVIGALLNASSQQQVAAHTPVTHVAEAHVTMNRNTTTTNLSATPTKSDILAYTKPIPDPEPSPEPEPVPEPISAEQAEDSAPAEVDAVLAEIEELQLLL